LFCSRSIDPDRAVIKFAKTINWSFLEAKFGEAYMNRHLRQVRHPRESQAGYGIAAAISVASLPQSP
jgi:hypothetical protein